ncbi:MAG: alpha/beta hydrolase [Akkermansiaceae bacterium]
MPTPIIYKEGKINPFEHLDGDQRKTRTQIFYATNRGPTQSTEGLSYGNRIESTLYLGEAVVRMGEVDTTWDDLVRLSMAEDSSQAVPLSLQEVIEMARIPLQTNGDQKPELNAQQQQFIDSINREISQAKDKEIMIYVHGTKVDFENAAILAAEVDHFAGRDFVGVAFSWPSHQNILYYLTGVDVRRALDSSKALEELIELLAEHSDAKHINILSYSAGGKVTTLALDHLQRMSSDLSKSQLQKKYKIGSVVCAAIDVEVHQFLDRLPGISQLANQVVITVTDDDNALKAGKRFMGGESRVGTVEVENLEEEFIARKHLENVEIIDISYGKKVRGFDITGHHYWYHHPWTSSDIVFLMRTDLPPDRRGLSQNELEGIWYFSPNYPEKIREAAAIELDGQW